MSITRTPQRNNRLDLQSFLRNPAAKALAGAALLALTYVSCGENRFKSDLNTNIELPNRSVQDMSGGCASPLAAGLLKVSQAVQSAQTFDVCQAPKSREDFKISERSSAEERRALLADQPLAALMAPPGVTFVRKSDNETPSSKPQPIILNVVAASADPSAPAATGEALSVTTVDVWSGQTELVALMESGATSLQALGKDVSVTILVNGWLPNRQEQWKHWVPASGFDFESKIPFKKINSAAPEGTVEVAGHLSNYALGSRTSMAAVHKNSKNSSVAKIGLHFGTFDPPHEGHLELSRYVLGQEGFTESILLPNYTAGHKPGASSIQDRVGMTVARVQDISPSRIEDRMNVFVGDSSFLMKEFGVGALFARVGALFATDQVWSLIGDDAWDGGILPSGILKPGMIMHYMVFPRGDRNPQDIHVPEYVRNNVKIVVMKDRQSLSSTLIRKKLLNGEEIPAEMMSPAVVRYIKERPHLYR